MKIKALALSLFVAGLGASYALADSGHGHGHGHGKPGSTTATISSTEQTTTAAEHGKGRKTGCRPVVSFVLNGTFVAVGADGSSFSMTVTHANHFGQTLGAAPTVTTDAETRIRRAGKVVSLADLQAGDRLNVQLRGCKAVAAGTTPSLVATRVFAHPVQAAPTGTTSTTTTTGTTTTTDTTTTTTDTTTTTGTTTTTP
ncbi:MAG TPA: hypothetical protein VNC40_05175 [Gaiellaceae bacterium]|nr:hypothetical protein [Gaiellaceae bacterium]